MSRLAKQLQQLRMVAEICHVQRASAEQRHLMRVADARQMKNTCDDAGAELSNAVGAWNAAAAGDLPDPGMARLWSIEVQDCRGAVTDAESRHQNAVAVQAEAADQARASMLRCRVIDELVETAGKIVARRVV